MAPDSINCSLQEENNAFVANMTPENRPNWRWYVGASVSSLGTRLLAWKHFPLTRVVPHGVCAPFDIQRFAKKRKLETIFDVGANTGQTVRKFVRFFPDSKIYSFEPVRDTYERLSRTWAEHKNISCFRKALGRVVETKKIRLHSNSELNTFVDQSAKGEHPISEEEVEIDTVDNFCSTEGISRIDVLKMDVQGWELEVLGGAAKMLASCSIHFVYAETAFRRTDNEMQHFAEFNDFLENHGFWLCGFYDSWRWGEQRQYLGFSNPLYIRPDVAGAP